MRYGFFATLFFVLFSTTHTTATDRVNWGVGRLFSNDLIGDRDDRWRTGAFVFSWLRGPEGQTTRPEQFGALVEYRFGSAIITPSNMTTPAPGDRRFAGVISFGVHTHFDRSGFEYSVGVDLVATGPQTGLGRFQTEIHDLFGSSAPSALTLANQIPNGFYPTALAEIARPVQISNRVTFRPFIEAQAGVESFVRAGGDVFFGPAFSGGVFVRDVTTGQLYQSTAADTPNGFSWVAGADVAKVFSSAYLPAADGYVLTPTRQRARVGVHWQAKRAGLFYGLTWLGPEFQAQPSGQLLGSMRFNFNF